jgi:protein TonB
MDEPAEQKLVFQEPGSSYRHALVTAGAFLLSLVINLALLAFIGYLDSGRQEQNSAAEQPVQTTVQLQTIKEVEARKETGSQDNNKKNPTDEAMPKNKPPAPEPVTNPQPLNLNQISNNFDLSTPEFRVQNLAPTRSSTSTSTSESSSNGSASKEQGNAFHRGELDQLPRKVSGPDPSFPMEARQNRTEGWVMLELDISRNGTVTSVSVLDWKGVPAFKQSALEAVRQWSFKPGKVNGSPVDAKNLRQRIRFQLLD